MPGHRYLLDTNILSDLIRNPSGAAGRAVASLSDPGACCTSSVVACELRYGARKKGSAKLKKRVDQLLAVLDVLPLDDDAAGQYAEARVALERAGKPIGGNDLLIAAQALALNLTVVTGNLKEFRRVPGLGVESWLDE
jgi:tRNA(fMet)-specific endonuclease VapC